MTKKYYSVAIKLGISDAVFKLGNYLSAIKLSNTDVMCSLGHYYQHIEKNYKEIKKYQLMTIHLNDVNAIYYIIYYYKTTEKIIMKYKNTQ